MNNNREMPCLTAEQVLAFVTYPADPEKVNLAAHIYGCEECREKVKTLMTAITNDNVMTEGDWTEIMDFTDKLRQQETPLKKLLARLQQPITQQGLDLNRITHIANGRERVCAAAADEDAPELALPKPAMVTAEADCRPDEPGYWKACFVIDAEARAEKKLKLNLVDGNGKEIPMARFFFLNVTAKVRDGQALLALDVNKLQNDMDMMYLEYPLGGKVTGHITQFIEE